MTIHVAGIDPSWSLVTSTPQAPSVSHPVQVQFNYSADNGDGGDLPDGTLTLGIFVGSTVSEASQCQVNTGPDNGNANGSSCVRGISAWGVYTLITSFSGGANVAATGNTEQVDIEPPAPSPESVTETWGTTAPTNSVVASATVIGSTANVAVTDTNWQGATSVPLSDNLGDTCTLSISGTTGTCAMAVTGTPSAFTIAYPGGNDVVTTQPYTAWGASQSQTVTFTWPAENVAVSNPSVTVQSATLEYTDVITRTATNVKISDYGATPPSTITLATGDKILLGAEAAGNVPSDPIAQGSIVYSASPAPTSMSDEQVSASDSCSDSWNFSGAIGDCLIVFNSPGTYTVHLSYNSTDSNYGDIDNGLTLTVDVS